MSEEFVINHNCSDVTERMLFKRGVDYVNLMRSGSHLDIADMTVDVDLNVPGIRPRTIKASKQISALRPYLANPFRSSYTLCISSFPSDKAAKQLAVYIMIKAIEYLQTKNSTRLFPLWHKLYGFPKDRLRDYEITGHDRPSLLILSNIVKDCSQLKLEKLRDILEMYSDIPKIVVMGGDDPYTFFACRLHLPITLGIHLSSESQPYYPRTTKVV